MKKFKYSVLIIGLIACFKNFSNNQINTIHDLEIIEKKSNYRITLALSLLAIIVYYNHQKILLHFQAHPCSSLILSYFIGTFAIDTYIEYKTMHKNLYLLKIIDKIYNYLKSALLIEPNTEKCLKYIEKYSSFSINEIENIVQTVVCQSLKCINCAPITQFECKYPSIHQLNCYSIDIYEVAIELKNEPDIYQELLHLKKNESIDKEKFLKKIGNAIKKNMIFLIINKNFNT